MSYRSSHLPSWIALLSLGALCMQSSVAANQIQLIGPAADTGIGAYTNQEAQRVFREGFEIEVPRAEQGATHIGDSGNWLLIGTTSNNAALRSLVEDGFVSPLSKPQGYSMRCAAHLKDPESWILVILGADERGALYGLRDLEHYYLSKFTAGDGRIQAAPFAVSDYPRIEYRGHWVWGVNMPDKKAWMDNMSRWKLNELIHWDNYPPAQAKEYVDFAHSRGIRVAWGFGWGWNPGWNFDVPEDFDRGKGTRVQMCSSDEFNRAFFRREILRKVREEYVPSGCDGIYFQSFTETPKCECRDCDKKTMGQLMLEFVNPIVDDIKSAFPDLWVSCGIHANLGIYDELKDLDPRCNLYWENCLPGVSVRGPNEDFGYINKNIPYGHGFSQTCAADPEYTEESLRAWIEKTDSMYALKGDMDTYYGYMNSMQDWSRNLLGKPSTNKHANCVADHSVFSRRTPFMHVAYAESLWNPGLDTTLVVDGLVCALNLQERIEKAPKITQHEALRKPVTLTTSFSPNYTAGGRQGLVDGKTAMDATPEDSRWQGYEGNGFEAVIDLGSVTSIRALSSGYLQSIEAGVFLPTQVEYALSANGTDYTSVELVKNRISSEATGSFRKIFGIQGLDLDARYVKIQADSIETIPGWHPAKGRRAWLFIDEILVNPVVIQSDSIEAMKAEQKEALLQKADVVVLGGSPSGLAAAVQGARLGLSVIVVEPYKHIGGMMSGGLTRTDLGHKATTNGIAAEFFKRVTAHYDPAHKPWSEQKMSFHFEPSVAESIWWEMVNETKRIRVIVPALLVSVTKDGERLRAIEIMDSKTGRTQNLEAEVFIDATYEGDLAAMAGAPFRVGREAKAEFQEPHALERADDLLQAYCFRLSVTDRADNRVPIQKPEGYDPAEFALLGEYVNAKSIQKFAPDCLFAREKTNGKADGNAQWHCWVSTDWSGINAGYPEGDYAARDAIYDEYARRTLGWFYYLQHDASIPEVLQKDALRWGLSKDEFADTNHLPFMLYVREARRIMGQYVFTELDATKNTTKPDSIGCGGYAIDSHHVKNFDRTNLHLEIPEGNERYGVKKGYQIPYRILVPQKVEGLLVSLCVSSTHLGYCTLRMEPEYMKMGQAAGAASYLAVQHKIPPEDIDVEELQEILRERGGVFLSTESVLPPDEIRTIPHDLVSPSMTTDAPAPGRRVRQVVPQYDGTGVHHALYLPTDWEKGKKYPVIVEYAGNGGYRGRFGDVCTGKVEDCNLGYGISGGEGFIWVCLPYISKDHAHNELNWWGDLEATAAYCKTVVPGICREYGGDPAAVFLAGFSRGSIACNFLGLHDDEIARLWRGFICHSHYDGIKKWDYAGSDRVSAAERLERLEGRPQFISQEGSVEETRRYLGEVYPGGPFTFLTPPYRNHTDTWVLRDIPERESLRQWIQNILLMCGEPQRAG